MQKKRRLIGVYLYHNKKCGTHILYLRLIRNHI
jgi:hypothetical protein